MQSGQHNYFQQELQRISKEVYPGDHVYSQIRRARSLMDSCYLQQITLDQLARESYFSKFHFLRLFNNSYGLTPRQYLTQVRIRQAKQLLLSGCTVEHACFEVGFESVNSFRNLFKKMTGKPPSSYRSQSTPAAPVGPLPLLAGFRSSSESQ